jgi:hypothetical protein
VAQRIKLRNSHDERGWTWAKQKRTEMKMTILNLVVVVAVSCSALLGCGRETETKNQPAQATQKQFERPMPSGYKLLCDGMGHYGMKYPSGQISGAVRDNKKSIVDFAWLCSYPDPLPVKHGAWIECDQ